MTTTMAVGQKRRTSDEGARPTFESAARGVMREVQEAFGRLIAGIPATAGRGGITKAADLQKALDVDPKLGWRVFRIANADNPLAAGAEVPSAVSMRKLFKAAAKQRVPANVIERANSAFEQFEQLVAEHAGDRDSFASMVSALSGAHSNAEDLNITARRAAFKAQSHILGLQARAHVACFAYRPSNDHPAMLDWLVVRGMVGLRRLRHDATWTLSRTRVINDDGSARQSFIHEPLDQGTDAGGGISLLREFCSRPLPRLRQTSAEMGFTNVEVIGEGIGNAAAQTCIVADVYRKAFVRYKDAENEAQGSIVHVRTPCELLIADIMVERGALGEPDTPPQARMHMLSDHRVVDPLVMSGARESDRLATTDAVTYLGRGLADLHTREFPRHREMLQNVLERMGWNPDAFDVYRCRIEFPVMPSSVVVQFDLPDKPKSK